MADGSAVGATADVSAAGDAAIGGALQRPAVMGLTADRWDWEDPSGLVRLSLWADAQHGVPLRLSEQARVVAGGADGGGGGSVWEDVMSWSTEAMDVEEQVRGESRPPRAGGSATAPRPFPPLRPSCSRRRSLSCHARGRGGPASSTRGAGRLCTPSRTSSACDSPSLRGRGRGGPSSARCWVHCGMPGLGMTPAPATSRSSSFNQKHTRRA